MAQSISEHDLTKSRKSAKPRIDYQPVTIRAQARNSLPCRNHFVIKTGLSLATLA